MVWHRGFESGYGIPVDCQRALGGSDAVLSTTATLGTNVFALGVTDKVGLSDSGSVTVTVVAARGMGYTS
jgi:hypothetical protein